MDEWLKISSGLEEILKQVITSSRSDLKRMILPDTIPAHYIKDLDIEEIRKDAFNYIKNKEDHIDPVSKAEVRFVSKNYLEDKAKGYHEGKVLGLYDPEEHIYYIDKSLSDSDTEYTYFHEQGHAIGYLSETKADEHARIVTGKTRDELDYSTAA